MHNTAYIAMGANLPFRGVSGGALLSEALAAMKRAGIAVTARSSVWRTAPWPPGAEQPDYYNAVVAADAGGRSPQALYAVLRSIEAAFGRERRERWEARTLDLDLVAVGDLVGEFGGIELPHPRMAERAFVLAPLAEIAPTWRHPVSGKTVSDLLAALPDHGRERLDPGWG